ncbi:MAG: MBOAT family protein, partial [Phaeodactylibacter sp.]|nr:MBOAT family protein [Phaeodactylibacter sp.]
FMKRKLPPHSFEDYLHYLFFLPTFLIGPINRFPNFKQDLIRRRWDAQMASYGLERILYGYFKITVLGNFLLSNQLAAAALRLQESRPWWGTYLEAVKYFMNSYFQFAGYSDIAIGLAALMGFRVMENFNFPFLARNVNDFWNRWHISLSAFARDYIYMPFVSMSRKPLVAILLTMLAIGLWHEFTARYVLWGLLHAMGVGVWHLFNQSRVGQGFNSRPALWKTTLSIFLTFNYVVFTFALIMRDDLAGGWAALRVLLGLN